MFISKPFLNAFIALFIAFIYRDIRLFFSVHQNDLGSLLFDSDGPYLLKYIFAGLLYIFALLRQRRKGRGAEP
jgi:hypothetical protein